MHIISSRPVWPYFLCGGQKKFVDKQIIIIIFFNMNLMYIICLHEIQKPQHDEYPQKVKVQVYRAVHRSCTQTFTMNL